MDATSPSSRWLFAAAMIALGITGLVNGDFALVWQGVPAHLPGRTAAAYLCATLEVVLGAGLLLPPVRRLSSHILLAYLVLWLVLLQLPSVVRAPLDAGAWGGVGEIGIMVAAALALAGSSAGAARAARWVLVLTLPMIGAEVIVDALRAGDAVMQPWLRVLPWPMAWACLTGLGSLATALALLSGVWPRLAATLEAAMLGLITVVYWGPDLYTGRTATTAFIISALVASGVWVVAGTYRGRPWLALRPLAWSAQAAGSESARYRV